MPTDTFPNRSEKTPIFILHLVQLSGAPKLLGAEQVTWKLSGTGINVVSGGNGSGKSLLCSAILAATLPRQHESLIHDLRIAGLHGITVVGQVGPMRREWSLDLRSGEVINRPRIVEEEAARTTPLSNLLQVPESDDFQVPHFVVNGEWNAPGEDQLAWAENMLTVPLEREQLDWDARLQSYLLGEAQPKPEDLRTEIAGLEAQIEHGRSIRADLKRAEEKREDLQMQIGDAKMAIEISAAEEKELVNKIDMAERCLHLENWANELRSSWSSVENTRTQFADLQERLEELQEMTRGLPDTAAEMARDYLALQAEREQVAARLKESEQLVASLGEQRSKLQSELRDLEGNRESDSTSEDLRSKLGDVEREITDLSRRRIDLLRKREGLERKRLEKFGELSALGPDEWLALEKFLEASNGGDMSPARAAELERKRAELARIGERLAKEFAGFEKLDSETPARISKLFLARESVTAREAELAALRSKAVELQHAGKGAGLKAVLSILGAGAAGVPTGAFLGWDVGFFAAVLGGGAGYGIGQMMTPKPEGNYQDVVSRIESLQHLQQAALSEREALRRELELFASLPDLGSAQTKWREYLKLADRKKELEAACALLATEEERSDTVLSVLRKLEREDIRRRVAEYKSLTAELTDATVELSSFDQEDGPQSRKSELEHEAQRLRELIHDIESRAEERRRERDLRTKELSSEIARLDSEFARIPETETERARLREILSKIETLDATAGGAFSKNGADTILRGIEERDALQTQLRETKSRLSTEHTPQELASRTTLIEEELKEVTSRLQEIDPLFASVGTREQGLTKYRDQMTQLAKQNVEREHLIQELSAEIDELQLDGLASQVDVLPLEERLLNERAERQSKLEDVERSIQTARDMCEALEAELSEQREHARGRLFTILRSVVFEAIGERFAAVEWRDGEWDVVTEDGQRRSLRTLSRGIAELVTLCLNSGLLFASTEAELAPVFWDDVLSQLDDHHLGISKQLIDHLARDRQVLLFTRDSRIHTWGRPVEVLAGRYEVDVLSN